MTDSNKRSEPICRIRRHRLWRKDGGNSLVIKRATRKLVIFPIGVCAAVRNSGAALGSAFARAHFEKARDRRSPIEARQTERMLSKSCRFILITQCKRWLMSVVFTQ
jgi:hypothetical protein